MEQSRIDFIKEAHEAACSTWKQRIEKEFPDLFKKSNLQAGKWYKNDDFPNLVFLDKIDKERNPKDHYSTFATGYGFSFTNNPVWSEDLHFADSRNFYLANEEEVKSALIEEAKRRYGRNLKVGAKVIGHWGIKEMTMNEKDDFYFDGVYFGVNGVCLFLGGKWATIIPQPKRLTKSEIEKELGYEIEIV